MRKMPALTQRQRQVYDFVRTFIVEKGYSPSFEEIGMGVGLASTATVYKHVQNLDRKGLLSRSYNRARSITLGPRATLAVPLNACPLCGREKSTPAPIQSEALRP